MCTRINYKQDLYCSELFRDQLLNFVSLLICFVGIIRCYINPKHGQPEPNMFKIYQSCLPALLNLPVLFSYHYLLFPCFLFDLLLQVLTSRETRT